MLENEHNKRVIRFIRFVFISLEIQSRFGFSILNNFQPLETTIDYSIDELVLYTIPVSEYQLIEINQN